MAGRSIAPAYRTSEGFSSQASPWTGSKPALENSASPRSRAERKRANRSAAAGHARELGVLPHGRVPHERGIRAAELEVVRDVVHGRLEDDRLRLERLPAA